MEPSSTTIEHLPLELVNKTLGYLDFWEAKNATASCKLFREGAAFSPKTIPKPIFDVTLIDHDTPTGPSLHVRLKLFNTIMERKHEYFLAFGDHHLLRKISLSPIPASRQDPANKIKTTRKHKEEFIRRFFPKMNGVLAPYDEFFEVTKEFFSSQAVIRCLNLDMSLHHEFCAKLADLFSTCPAESLMFYSAFMTHNPPTTILKCAKSTDRLHMLHITREFLDELLQLRINKWVSVAVDSWFDDATLVSLPFKKMVDLRFSGHHSITLSGISQLVLSFLDNVTRADAPQWTAVDAGLLSLSALGGNAGIYIEDREFEPPDLNRCKDFIERLAERPGISVSLATVAACWPLSKEHYLVESARIFIRIFPQDYHFYTLVRFVFFLKTW